MLEACRLSLLSERRDRAPTGAAGGEPGLPGRNLVNGREVPAKATLDLEAGDVVRDRDPGRRRLRSAYAGVSRSSRGTRCSSRVAPTPATRHAVAARSQSAFGERWSTKPPIAGPMAKPISHESVENAM